ncbi:unnamed protein product, partial [Rotaria magnacalcarata]
MQRPIRGYRGDGGGIRMSSHLTNSHNLNDDDNVHDRLLLSNSNFGELEDDDNNNDKNVTVKSKDSSILSSTAISADLESVICNLRPLKIQQKKAKTNSNINSQKADLPQLNMISDTNNMANEQTKDKKLHHWFPKPDIGHAKSNDFIRHNHI